jgi:hypothetical protein
MLKNDLILMLKYIAVAGAHFLPALVIGSILSLITGSYIIGWLAGIIVTMLTPFLSNRLY